MLSNQLSRRRFLQMTGIGAAGALLAACAVPAAPSAPAAEGGEAAPSADKIILTRGHHWEASFRPRQEEFDAMFLERHPEFGPFEITYNTWAEHNQIVPTWAAAGTLPDTIYVHGRYAFPWAFEGITRSLQDYVDNDAEFNVEGIWEESLRLYRFEDKVHAIPYDHGPIILGYNKDLFDEAGIAYPDATWTTDTLLETALALTKDNQWGFTGGGNIVSLGNEYGIALVGPWGGQVLDESETQILLDSPESLAALQWWADLIHVHKVSPTPADAEAIPAGLNLSGMAAMFALASWSTPDMHQSASFAWDVAPWPKGPAAQVTGSFGSGFAITRDSKSPDGAWTYLSEYLSVEGMEFMWGSSGRGSPARKDAYQSWMDSDIAPDSAEYYLEALDTYAVTGRPYQTLAGGEILDIFNRNTDLIQTGDMTVEEGVAAIIAEGAPVLQEAAARLQG